MSVVRRAGRAEAVWAYLSQGMSIGAGLLILPLLVRFVSPAEVSLWFVFVTLGALAALLDFGLQPTLSRNVAYAYAGARTLLREGLDHTPAGGAPNYDLLRRLLVVVRRMYAIVGLLSLLLLGSVGAGYVYWVSGGEVDRRMALTAWALYAAGTVLNFFFAYLGPFLQGRGAIVPAHKSNVWGRVAFLGLGAVLLVLGFGLAGLAAATLAGAITTRILAHRYFFDHETRMALRPDHSPAPAWDSELFRAVWHNARRLGLVTVGAFLILRANLLLASAYLGLAASASFALTQQILVVLSNLAAVILGIQMPRLNALRVAGRVDAFRGEFAEANVASCLIFAVGALGVGGLGPWLLESLGSQTALVAAPFFATMALVALLELHHSNHAVAITTSNSVPFVPAALLSGGAIVVLSVIFLEVSGLGLWGLLLAQAVVQAVYNNWKWPVINAAELGMSVARLSLLGCHQLYARLVTGKS